MSVIGQRNWLVVKTGFLALACWFAPAEPSRADEPCPSCEISISSSEGENFDRLCQCASEKRGPRTLFRWTYDQEEPEPFDPFDGPITTDRPDFTENSATVGKGVFQIETGFTYERDNSGGVLAQGYTPDVLFRVGMFADWFEFRLGYSQAFATEDDNGTYSTLNESNDIYLGLKLMMTTQYGILPEMSIMPQMTVPTGGENVSAKQVMPGVNWLYAWVLNDRFTLAGSSQINRANADSISLLLDPATGDIIGATLVPGGEYYASFAQSASLATTLIPDKLGMYTEWFMFVPIGSDSGASNEQYFNGGFTYLVNNNLQLDIRAGVGLNDASADMFTGAGFSIRL